MFISGVVQSLSRVQLFATLWTAEGQASLSITNSRSLLKLMSIESVMPSNHLILCHPLLLLPSIFPRVRLFSSESALHIRWLKCWSFSFGISPSMFIQGWLPLGLTGLIFFLSKRLWRDHCSKPSVLWCSAFFMVRDSEQTTVRNHQFFGAQPSLWSRNLGFCLQCFVMCYYKLFNIVPCAMQ